MTAKYPVDLGDDEGIVDAVNYLLSGPSGLGQNFAGFSSYATAYLTGNFRIPYTQTDPSSLYVSPIAIDTADMLDSRTIKFDFTTAGLATPPFSLGQGLSVYGNSVNFYNDAQIVQIGVVECTNTYVIVRILSPQPLQPQGTGGFLEFYVIDGYNSTDAECRVTVTGATDRVFISAQLDQLVSYEVLAGSQDLTVYVTINRYVGQLNDDPTNPDFFFQSDSTVVEKVVGVFTGLTGTGTLPLLETVFATLIDQPPPGFYRYFLEVYFETDESGDIQITQDELGVRSISAQVVKQ
jgi:hypothetical protein